jgi:uncharacterized membrane protein YeaQ/YmgE (transglycosylase-associated protein family)
MGILSWIVMGLIVGLLAKFIMPGKDPGGIIITILIGIGGGFLGGYIGSQLGIGYSIIIGITINFPFPDLYRSPSTSIITVSPYQTFYTGRNMFFQIQLFASGKK